MRAGHTLPEVAIVLACIALAAAVAVPRIVRERDRAEVAAAAAELAGAFQLARDRAIADGRPVAVLLAPHAGTVTVRRGADTLLHRDLAAAHGVELSATRESTAYLPDGLAAGAANLGATLGRGSVARTLAVSRLGRVRW